MARVIREAKVNGTILMYMFISDNKDLEGFSLILSFTSPVSGKQYTVFQRRRPGKGRGS